MDRSFVLICFLILIDCFLWNNVGKSTAKDKIQQDCEAYGTFVIDGTKYECAEVR